MAFRTRALIGAACAALVIATLPPAAAAADPLAGVATDGLIAAYDFSETAGTVLADAASLAGAQNGVVMGGASWSSGAMRFTGANYVKLPDNLLSGSTAATVVVEMKPATGALGGNNFTWNLGGSGNASTGQFFLHTPGHRASISRTNWSGEQTAVTPAAFVAERWQSVTVTIAPNAGGGTHTLTVFVDGAQVAQKTDSDTGIANLVTQTNNLIGASAYSGDAKFTGAISTYRLYNRALTAGEVATISSVDAITAAQETVAGLSLGDLTDVTSDLALPTSGGITWSTSNASVVEADGTVHRVEGTTGTATLTASATVRGQTSTRQFDVTVAPLPNAAQRAQEDLDAIALPAIDDVRDNLTLPGTGSVYGSDVVWTAEPEGVISTSAEEGRAPGIVTRPVFGQSDAEITLTARVPGTDAERMFAATVRALPEHEENAAYLFAHFTAGRSPNTINEQMYFATSEDGAQWTDLNGEQPVLRSTVGETGARDPFLVRAPGGDKFYLLATDLSTALYGWRFTPENPGSKNLVVWESTDLVNWSAPRLVDVASKIPQAGAAWAPEATYDPATGEYLVYWATASGAGAEHPLGNALGDRMNMYYATTRDFVTFSDPVKWIDRTSSIIDTTMVEVDGVFYRASGDGQITLERSTDPYAVTVSATAPSSNPGGWERVSTLRDVFGNDNYAGTTLEGPELFAYNPQDWLADETGEKVPTWGLMADRYSGSIGRGYLPFRSTDLASVSPATQGGGWSVGDDIDFDAVLKRHGTILPVTKSEYDRLMQRYGDTATRIASIAVTAQPGKTSYAVGEELDAAGLQITATTVAGTTRVLATNEYSLEGFDSSAPGTPTITVTLDAAPQIATSFTVTVSDAPVLDVSAAVAARCVAGKVVQIVSVTNGETNPVTVKTTSPFGATSLSVGAGQTVSQAFSTRLSSVEPGTVVVDASRTTGGQSVAYDQDVAFAAASCG